MHDSDLFVMLAPWESAFSAGTAILNYHKVGPRPAGLRLEQFQMPTRWLDRQLSDLVRAGFRSTTLGGPAAGAPKQVVITFDDGSRSTLVHAAPVLRRHDLRAIQFLVAGEVGGFNRWDTTWGEARDENMTAEEVRQWLAEGHEIGSHTLSHPKLTNLPLPDARREIVDSRKQLEDQFGVPIRHFAYPYGHWSPAIRDLAAEAGYETACTTELGIWKTGDHPLSLPRVVAQHPIRKSPLAFLKDALRPLLARLRPAPSRP